MKKKFSHIDEEGNAKMVDVGNKEIVHRKAIAVGIIQLQPETIDLLKNKALKKGDVLTVAKIAGIQAAKITSTLIPLCHQINLSNVDISFTTNKVGVEVKSTVSCYSKTGVEMEALTAVTVALLTIYDMCKAVDKEMYIQDVKLVEKTKGAKKLR